jgi:glycosyltransferase involved in cell wall biosynthesis
METKRNIRIAMVTYLFPPTFAGGARQAIELARALRQCGVESFFVGANLEDAPDYEIYEGFPIHRIKTKNKTRTDFLFYSLNVCRKLISNRKSYQVIHLHSIRPFYFLIFALSRIMKKTVVLSLTLIGHDDPMSLKERSFLWQLEYKIYKLYDKIICSSTAIKNSCRRAGIPDSTLAPIPCAIPCGDPDSLFRPAYNAGEVQQIRSKFQLPLNSFIVAFAGRIQTRKGCDLLFEAWEKLLTEKQFSGYLLLIGPYDNPLYPADKAEEMFISYLRSLLEKRKEKRMIFVGNVDHSQVAEYLRASDCFIFPSKREGFGMVAVEAMASGIPVICTRIPEITTDMIDSGVNGIILDGRDSLKIGKAISRIKEDEKLRKRLASNAIAKVSEKFSIRRVVSQHLDVYHNLVNNVD